jgi:hypothetical protein
MQHEKLNERERAEEAKASASGSTERASKNGVLLAILMLASMSPLILAVGSCVVCAIAESGQPQAGANIGLGIVEMAAMFSLPMTAVALLLYLWLTRTRRPSA